MSDQEKVVEHVTPFQSLMENSKALFLQYTLIRKQTNTKQCVYSFIKYFNYYQIN